MNLKDLATKAKELVDKRGGTGSLKEDADELKRIAQGEGSVTDKAKAAAGALKDPGVDEPAAEATPAERERAAGKVEGEARGKHGRGRGGGQGKRRGGGGRGGGRGRDRV